jgi:rhamnose utilization protein RhaD (predicted bifunctional aldolase and dehydrogenase)
MKYKVHRVEVKSKTMQENLEQYINNLHGEIVSIIPHVRPTFQLMGATAKIDYILIVEKKI